MRQKDSGGAEDGLSGAEDGLWLALKMVLWLARRGAD